jgi:anti-anti-sigma factor
MLDTIGSGLRLDVERGPDWLFVRVTPPADGDWYGEPSLADAVWTVVEQHFTYRVVLELDRVTLLRSLLLGQLVQLAKRVREHGGILRLCGISPDNHEVLTASRLDTMLPEYADRSAAVMCMRPR